MTGPQIGEYSFTSFLRSDRAYYERNVSILAVYMLRDGPYQNCALVPIKSYYSRCCKVEKWEPYWLA